jgi:hypothetical protein
MFTSNNDVINVDIQDTKFFFKDIHAKRMDSVKIISIDKNLTRTVSVTFQSMEQLECRISIKVTIEFQMDSVSYTIR